MFVSFFIYMIYGCCVKFCFIIFVIANKMRVFRLLLPNLPILYFSAREIYVVMWQWLQMYVSKMKFSFFLKNAYIFYKKGVYTMGMAYRKYAVFGAFFRNFKNLKIF